MDLVFFETPLFSRLMREYLTDQSYRELQLALLLKPDIGSVMPGTGGFANCDGRTRNAEKESEGGYELFTST